MTRSISRELLVGRLMLEDGGLERVSNQGAIRSRGL